MDVFKKPYVLRSFEKARLVGGYSQSPYSDRIVKLGVQPVSATELLALPEGIRRTKNVKVFGRIALKTADELEGTLADRLYYQDHWWECTGADHWGITPVGQTEAVFGLIGNAEDAALLLPPNIEKIKADQEERQGSQ